MKARHISNLFICLHCCALDLLLSSSSFPFHLSSPCAVPLVVSLLIVSSSCLFLISISASLFFFLFQPPSAFFSFPISFFHSRLFSLFFSLSTSYLLSLVLLLLLSFFFFVIFYGDNQSKHNMTII